MPNTPEARAARLVIDVDVHDFFGGVFYRNCKVQRRRGAKICGACPFRSEIARLEKGKETP